MEMVAVEKLNSFSPQDFQVHRMSRSATLDHGSPSWPVGTQPGRNPGLRCSQVTKQLCHSPFVNRGGKTPKLWIMRHPPNTHRKSSAFDYQCTAGDVSCGGDKLFGAIKAGTA